MRFMIIVKANRDSEAGILPSRELITEMGKFNEELVKAGVMLAAEGLQSSSMGVRVRFSNGRHAVTRGPFPDPESLVAGYWLWKLDSLDDAISWIKRAPFRDTEIEIRQVFETEDFAASDPTGELRKQEERLRAQIAGKR
ncbi:MAG TPA: YciI family protein [Terriglobales bacterium]|nr:YciI family protein [Terriglobales bacterium]